MVNKSNQDSNDTYLLYFFLFVPTIMLLIGYFIFPFPQPQSMRQILLIPLFLGLILIGAGFVLHKIIHAFFLKIVGWIIFAFFWSTKPAFLYFSEGGDVFNAVVCILGVYVLIYMAYHEWLSHLRNEKLSCLNWIAGGTFIAGLIYFLIDTSVFPVLKEGLISIVADQTTGLLNLFGLEAERAGHVIYYNESPITIIFACTAIQSMVLFVGMIGALAKASLVRRIIALCVTVVPIYFLNLIRNAGVIYLVGNDITSFSMAHNVIAKAGSLVALIILLFITFKALPSLYDELLCIFDLSKRNGPVEKNIARVFLGKK